MRHPRSPSPRRTCATRHTSATCTAWRRSRSMRDGAGEHGGGRFAGHLPTGGGDETPKLCNTTGGLERVHPFEVGRCAVLAVVAHRKMAYVGSYDGHAIMWDLDTTAFAAGQMTSGFPDLHSAADGGAIMGPMFVRHVSVGRRSATDHLMLIAVAPGSSPSRVSPGPIAECCCPSFVRLCGRIFWLLLIDDGWQTSASGPLRTMSASSTSCSPASHDVWHLSSPRGEARRRSPCTRSRCPGRTVRARVSECMHPANALHRLDRHPELGAGACVHPDRPRSGGLCDRCVAAGAPRGDLSRDGLAEPPRRECARGSQSGLVARLA
jgi:hypothetical protein